MDGLPEKRALRRCDAPSLTCGVDLGWIAVAHLLKGRIRSRLGFIYSAIKGLFAVIRLYSFSRGRASFEARSPIVLLVQEQLPFRNAVDIAKERRDGQLFGSARHGEQLQAGFMRQ